MDCSPEWYLRDTSVWEICWVLTQGLYCTTCKRFSHSCWEAQCCNVKGILQFYRDDFVCNRKHLLIWIVWCIEFLGIIITKSVYSTQRMSAYSWVGNVKGVVHNTNVHCVYSSWHGQKQYWAGLRKQTVFCHYVTVATHFFNTPCSDVYKTTGRHLEDFCKVFCRVIILSENNWLSLPLGFSC
jgi:hypothetical protein